MSSKKVNNVINLLIDEIKIIEKTENIDNLSKEKGINVAKSFLNENYSDKKTLKFVSDKEEKINKLVNVEKEQEKEKELEQEKEQEDNISESEKKVLEFYDEKIDDYNEEYVNKKYRFYTKNCDSSLCCCGCFTPVCYQSQRHEHYVNQYRSLYAVNVKLDKEIILDEKEINSQNKKNENDSNSDSKEKQEEKKKLNNSITKREKMKKKEEESKYHPVFCINCNNHIAYFEIKEKVFHFFDVLPD